MSRALLDERLPKLAQANLSPSETYALLLDIGEDFRHILYHIMKQQKFYEYIVPEWKPDTKTGILKPEDRRDVLWETGKITGKPVNHCSQVPKI